MPNINNANTVSHLNIKLSAEDINTINECIEKTQGIDDLSARGLLSELKAKGMNAPIFSPLYKFFSSVEDVKKRTYIDSAGDMTIGIGLDIQSPAHDNAEALFHALNPDRDWNFSQMQTEINMPVPELVDVEISELLLLTLIGATYPEKDMTYPGQTEKLITSLEKHDLADVKFKPNEMIVLQSLSYNANSLIGDGLCNALKQYKLTGDFRPVLVQIVDCSNRLYSKETGKPIAGTNGLENGRLKNAGMFCGHPEKVHISYRKYFQIEAALKELGQTVVPQNGEPIYGSPYADEGATYEGGSQLQTFPGCADNDPSYYGTWSDETLNIKNGSTVTYSGRGNDCNVMAEKPENVDSTIDYPYLAGNSDFNIYKLKTRQKRTLIDDMSHNGMLQLDDDIIQGVALQKENNSYKLTVKDTQYNLVRKNTLTEEDNSLTVDSSTKLHINRSSNKSDKTIVNNFIPGQFNIGFLSKAYDFYPILPVDYSVTTIALDKLTPS